MSETSETVKCKLLAFLKHENSQIAKKTGNVSALSEFCPLSPIRNFQTTAATFMSPGV